jgi:3-hydroxyisobutyrate dehydrogenase-like beta-hydroxyacid dehydrogenase
MDIGFIGLGHMGSGIAANLIKAGHSVRVWNRSPGPVEALVRAGAERAASPAEALTGEVAFSMLSQDDVIEEVLIASGALDEARPGLVHVNLATVSVAFAQRMEAEHERRKLAYVAAPVLGRPDVAARGELNVLCAGPTDAVDKVAPLLATFAAKVWTFGDAAHRANVVKLCSNFALATVIETLGETGALAEAYGVAPRQLYEMMTSTLFAAPAYKVYAPIILESKFTPAAFKLPLGHKDVRLAIAAGEAAHTPLPLASVLRDHFVEAEAAGDGDKDWAALAAGAFRRAGLKLPH